MKKIITLVLILALGLNLNAQDKDFRFGLKVEPSFNWLAPDKTFNNLENDGVKMGFAIGAMTDFRLGGNIWLSTGVAIDFNGAKLNYTENNNSDGDTTGYFFGYVDNTHNLEGVVEVDEVNRAMNELDTVSLQSYSLIQLENRTYKVRYINIPLYIKMKTNEIGYMTYFGQFGLNTSVKTKAIGSDKGQILLGSDLGTEKLQNLAIESEVPLIKMGGVIGAGFEYNISDATSLIVAVNYDYGFTSLVKKNSKHIIDFDRGLDGSNYQVYTPQKAIPHAVRITVGILF